MPLRIAIVASITIAACLVVPVTVNAVTSPKGESISENADDPDPGEAVPIGEPTGVAANSDRTVGNQIGAQWSSQLGPSASAAVHQPQMSGTTLAMLIVAGLVPSLLMILRSSRRRRAGSVDMA